MPTVSSIRKHTHTKYIHRAVARHPDPLHPHRTTFKLKPKFLGQAKVHTHHHHHRLGSVRFGSLLLVFTIYFISERILYVSTTTPDPTSRPHSENLPFCVQHSIRSASNTLTSGDGESYESFRQFVKLNKYTQNAIAINNVDLIKRIQIIFGDDKIEERTQT